MSFCLYLPGIGIIGMLAALLEQKSLMCVALLDVHESCYSFPFRGWENREVGWEHTKK